MMVNEAKNLHRQVKRGKNFSTTFSSRKKFSFPDFSRLNFLFIKNFLFLDGYSILFHLDVAHVSATYVYMKYSLACPWQFIECEKKPLGMTCWCMMDDVRFSIKWTWKGFCNCKHFSVRISYFRSRNQIFRCFNLRTFCLSLTPSSRPNQL